MTASAPCTPLQAQIKTPSKVSSLSQTPRPIASERLHLAPCVPHNLVPVWREIRVSAAKTRFFRNFGVGRMRFAPCTLRGLRGFVDHTNWLPLGRNAIKEFCDSQALCASIANQDWRCRRPLPPLAHRRPARRRRRCCLACPRLPLSTTCWLLARVQVITVLADTRSASN